MPKLTLITVNLNNAIGLEETIKSVLQQTFRDYEYIIIDGGSSDGSVDVIREHKDRLSYFISEPDNGIYHAMNKGIRQAKGEYLLFLNSGDYLCEPESIKRLLQDTPDSDLICGDMERLFPDGTKDLVMMPVEITAERLLNNTLCHPVTLIKRSLFETFGLYDEQLKIVADWAFFLKTIVIGGASYTHKSVNVAVFSMDGMSSSLSNQQLIKKEREMVIKQYFSPALYNLILEKQLYESYYKRYRIKYINGFLKHLKRKLSAILNYGQLTMTRILSFPRTLQTLSALPAYKIKNKEFCLNIPIIINNRNRLSYLKELIGSLEKRGYKNIFIIDNDSDYAELIKYYKTLPYKIFFLGRNAGYCALWDSEVFAQFKDQYYIYTDSDMKLVESCPDDFVVVMKYFLEKYNQIGKIGLSIITDNIPDHFALKNEVLMVEANYWKIKKEKMVYDAKVDTTFALYKPNCYGDALRIKAFRTAYPYSVYHLPWYEDIKALDEEQIYYYQNANASSHWGTVIKQTIDSQPL